MLSIDLNLVLIPLLGVVGAASATLAAHAAMAMVGHRLLPVRLPWACLARSSAAAAIMVAAVYLVHPGQRLITVAVRAPRAYPFFANRSFPGRQPNPLSLTQPADRWPPK